MKRLARFCLFLTLAALGGCTLGVEQTGAPGGEPTAEGAATGITLTRAEGEARMKAIARRHNAFAAAFFERLRQERPGNLVCSPYCIATGLGMTLLGARGQTARQMARVLALDGIADPQADATALEFWLGEQWQAGNVLANANALWGLKDYNYSQACLDQMRLHYDSLVRPADFAAPGRAAGEINAWAAGRTQDKFTQLVAPEELGAATRLALLNAVYFKGLWKTGFPAAETREAPFFTDARTSRDAPMMFVLTSCGVYPGDTAEVLELPFQGERLAMDIILPRKVDGLKTLDLSAASLEQWLAGLRSAIAAVHLPRFELQTQATLNATLAGLGMPDAFQPGTADFSGMSEKRQRDLSLGLAVQQAWLCVDEAGAEDSGVTAQTLGELGANMAPPLLFVADHPFAFVIRDRLSGVILFLGQVTAP